MSQNNIRMIAAREFNAAWNDRLPIEWENAKFTRPNNGAWARYTMTTGQTEDAAIGGELERTAVVFGCQIRIPKRQGVKLAYEIADALKPALELKQFRSDDGRTVMRTGRISITRGGEQEGKMIFAVTITAQADTE